MIDYISMMNAAIEAKYGVKIRTNDPNLLRKKLYPERKKFPHLLCLAFVIPPVNSGDELWIVKKELPDGAEEG